MIQVAKKKAGAKKTARGRTKRGVRKPARKAAPKRAAKKPARRASPKLVAKKPAARATQAVSFPQRVGAPARLTVLFELARARTAVLAAIQGLVPGSAEQPHAEGAWNTRQHVLHLAYWDEVYAADIEPALRGELPPAATYTKEDDDRVNAAALERLDHLSWDEALRRLHTARQRLLEAVENVAEDAALWTGTHPFVRILRTAVLHDRHHADAIKRWRTETNA